MYTSSSRKRRRSSAFFTSPASNGSNCPPNAAASLEGFAATAASYCSKASSATFCVTARHVC